MMRVLIPLILLLPSLAARDVRLLRIEAPEDAPSLVFAVRGESVAEIDTPRLSPSRRRLAVGAETVRLYLAWERPTKEKPLPADAPAIDLPAGEEDLLVILYPRAGAGPLAVQGLPVAIPRDPARAGALLWLNLTSRVVSVNLGSGPTLVPSGQGRLVVPPAAPGKPYPVLIDLGPAKPGEEPQPMVRATWIRRDAGRQFLFVLPDAERDSPRIVSVPDLDDGPPPAKVLAPSKPEPRPPGPRR